MNRVCVIIPIKPSLHPALQARAVALAARLPAANRELAMALHVDYQPEASRESDGTPWSKVTRVRNRLLETIGWHNFDYLLWIDADVTDYPADMPAKLIEAAGDGVAAPMVLIEDTVALLYDFAAFVMEGCSHIEPETHARIVGRNLQHEPPYWPAKPTQTVVPMDCVGTITMVHTDIYVAGAHYQDHPAFTDHFPICAEARAMGRPVVVCRDLIATHANLPKFGEAWH